MDWATYEIDFTREGKRRVNLFSYLLGYPAHPLTLTGTSHGATAMQYLSDKTRWPLLPCNSLVRHAGRRDNLVSDDNNVSRCMVVVELIGQRPTINQPSNILVVFTTCENASNCVTLKVSYMNKNVCEVRNIV